MFERETVNITEEETNTLGRRVGHLNSFSIVAMLQSRSHNQSTATSTFEMVPTTTSVEGIRKGWEESLAAIPGRTEGLEANLVLALKADILSLHHVKSIRRQIEMLSFLVNLEPSGSGSGSSNLWLFPHLPKELQMKIWTSAVVPNIVSEGLS